MDFLEENTHREVIKYEGFSQKLMLHSTSMLSLKNNVISLFPF